ncbi:fungal transcription factor [Colletotrichum incanum]|nr:fungal transcription factor [Colletotrichum incanum]
MLGVDMDMPTTNSPLLDIDLFTSVAEAADSNIALDWTIQQTTAFKQLDSLLVNKLSPRPCSHSDLKEDITPAELSTLHNCYFESIYFSFPFLNKDRFLVEYTSTGGPAISALVYAVALSGCAHSPKYSHKQSVCYNLARSYADKCERDDHLSDLNFLQALLFIGRFEAMDRKLERSWLTLGRAAMLCKLLGLLDMDEFIEDNDISSDSGRDRPHMRLPPTDDRALLEERRRTL